MNGQLQLKPKRSKKLNSNKTIFVFQTQIFIDEISHCLRAVFDDYKEALNFAKEEIIKITGPNYRKLSNGYYNNIGDTVCIFTIGERFSYNNNKDENLQNNVL